MGTTNKKTGNQKTKEEALDEVFNQNNRKEWINKVDNKKTKPKKKITLLLTLLVIAIILLFSVLLCKDKIFAFIETNLPSVHSKITKLVGENSVSESQVSYSEIEASLASTKEDLKKAISKLKDLEDSNAELQAIVKDLKPYKETATSFQQEKNAWDTSIAMENPEVFLKYYEKMNPETAKSVYEILKADALIGETEQTYIKTINGLDDKKAAALIQELLKTDENLAVTILENLNVTKNTAILNNLETSVAAKLAKLRDPFENTHKTNN